MSSLKVLGKTWIIICALADVGLIASVLGGVIANGIRDSAFAYISLAVALSVFLLAPFLAFTYVLGHKANKARKHGFLAVASIHVVLALLIQIGPSAAYLIPGLVLPGLTYFVLAFLTQRQLAQQ